MISTIEKNIDKLQAVIYEWLSPKNIELKEAIDKTVNEGLFSFEDIKFQILALKKTLKKGEFERWAKRSGADAVTSDLDKPKNVLCLHAGNLPLVGLQDILAVVISGNRYLGKLSKKDPYLPGTLLSMLKKYDLVDGAWSTELSDLADTGQKADLLMFSGSTDSVDPVIQALEKYQLAGPNTPQLVRTAHYSLALIQNDKANTFQQLAEAVLRYGGSGCRSVALVVAPFSLHSKKCEFTDYMESFWLKNPQHKKPTPSLYHRYAYNKAIGVEQSWLDDFLIEETDMMPTDPFVLHWVVGDLKTFNELALKYHSGLQSLYVTHPDIQTAEGLPDPEMLSDAQEPPIWWKPDGVDPLKWLIES